MVGDAKSARTLVFHVVDEFDVAVDTEAADVRRFGVVAVVGVKLSTIFTVRRFCVGVAAIRTSVDPVDPVSGTIRIHLARIGANRTKLITEKFSGV